MGKGDETYFDLVLCDLSIHSRRQDPIQPSSDGFFYLGMHLLWLNILMFEPSQSYP